MAALGAGRVEAGSVAVLGCVSSNVGDLVVLRGGLILGRLAALPGNGGRLGVVGVPEALSGAVGVLGRGPTKQLEGGSSVVGERRLAGLLRGARSRGNGGGRGFARVR